MKLQLIENAGKWWRMFSVQAMGIAMALQGAWATVPDDLKAPLPPTLVNWVSIGLLLFGIVGRLVQQPAVSQPTVTPPDGT
jgi:hypothetical protein